MAGSIQVTRYAIFGYDLASHTWIPILVDPAQQDASNSNELYSLLPVRVTNLPALGPQTSGQSLSIVLPSDLAALPTANFVGGIAISVANPYPSADQINLYINTGQAFFVSTDLLTAAAANQAFMLTNPAASGKVFEVYRFNSFNSNANATCQVRIANPALAAFGTDITTLIGNMNQASGTTSVARASYATTTTSPPASGASSIPFWAGNTALSSDTEFLQNNARIILNANESLVIYQGNTAAGKVGANYFWIER